MSYGVAVHVGCGVMAREYAFWTDGGTCTRHQILLEEAPPLTLPAGHDDWAAYAREQMDATRAQMLST